MFEPLPNIKPSAKTCIPSRKLALHPVCMVTCFFVATFFLMFFSENRYVNQTVTTRSLITYSWALVFYVQFYLFVGQPLHFLMTRNIPFLIACLLFLVVVITEEAAVAMIFFDYYRHPSVFFWHIFSSFVAFIPATIICTFFFEKQIRNIFGYNPAMVPYWLPVNREADVLQTMLPRNRRGQLQKMQSANQYVVVTTDNGTHELRATLKSLLEIVPASEGIHLHRSVWLHRSQIKEFGYENGNPCITDIHGDKIRVSRSKVATIKQLLLKSG